MPLLNVPYMAGASVHLEIIPRTAGRLVNPLENTTWVRVGSCPSVEHSHVASMTYPATVIITGGTLAEMARHICIFTVRSVCRVYSRVLEEDRCRDER